ncbi:hypothetical protein CKO41_12755 [Thiococcus pfennigii]|jgi:hypothetical protein|nr:hypothetical protein [Thiococcus pfennigii]
MMHDYKFRDRGTPNRPRSGKRGSNFIRLLMLLLSIGVLALIALSVRDVWLADTEAPAGTEPGLIPLPLPPSTATTGQ